MDRRYGTGGACDAPFEARNSTGIATVSFATIGSLDLTATCATHWATHPCDPSWSHCWASARPCGRTGIWSSGISLFGSSPSCTSARSGPDASTGYGFSCFCAGRAGVPFRTWYGPRPWSAGIARGSEPSVTWKSRCRGPGRPSIGSELGGLIREMANANPLVGRAPDAWRHVRPENPFAAPRSSSAIAGGVLSRVLLEATPDDDVHIPPPRRLARTRPRRPSRRSRGAPRAHGSQ